MVDAYRDTSLNVYRTISAMKLFSAALSGSSNEPFLKLSLQNTRALTYDSPDAFNDGMKYMWLSSMTAL